MTSRSRPAGNRLVTAANRLAQRLNTRWADVTLRTKITGVTVFILSLGLFTAGIGTQSFLRPQLIAAQDAELRQIQADPRVLLGATVDLNALTCSDVTGAPRRHRFFVAVLDDAGNIYCDNRGYPRTDIEQPPLTIEIPEQDITLPFAAVGSDGVGWRAAIIPLRSYQGGEGGALLIALSTISVENTMTRLVLIFSGFSVAVLLLGAALTRILDTNTFAPLVQVEQTALEISHGDFTKRLMVTSTQTEVGHLSQSLNAMLDHINESFDERQHTIEQMRRFISDAGHELRTPLVSVRGYAEMYRHGWLADNDQLAQAMERIEKEAIRMSSLVDDLLALARLDERRPLRLKALPLNQLAHDTALDTRVQAPDRTIRVIEDPADPLVSGDEHRVRQVMGNLIGNALRYTPAGSPIEIRVSADRSSDTASFAIIDHGEGIPQQFHHQIFDRFWRADTSRNRETGGSGLGLAIVYSIVTAHQGTVSIRETPGGGATFTVELPLAS